MSDKKKDKSRRAFLRTGLTAGLTAAAGLGGGSLLASKSLGTGSSGKVKALTTDGRLIEVDADQIEVKPDHENIGRKESMIGLTGRKFVMVVDLALCKNARKCVDACQEGHYLPKDHEWIKLYYMQDSPRTSPYWFPRPCYHCDNPMCVSVCPVGATYKRADGIVLVDNERCIGCKFCMTGCPYSARVFHWEKSEVEQPDVEYSPETNVPSEEGTVGKCVWCADLLRKNKLPRCVSACPMGVIYFGDMVEDTVTNGMETVRLSALLKDRAGYRHREELGTSPGVYYLPPVERSFTVESGFEGQDEEIIERYKGHVDKK
ncbi:MAG TPA: 4Fe-4S dicluster domain-containing protein [Bacteroides sp.]|nr:4Fe-4S dicluster domain-containing protein [Bacteroides sp.]